MITLTCASTWALEERDRLVEEVVISLWSSAVERPSPENLTLAGLNAIQRSVPCFEHRFISHTKLALGCSNTNKQLAWPPRDAKDVDEVLETALGAAHRGKRPSADVQEAVARALASSLGDPYTAYFPPREVRRLDTKVRTQIATGGIALAPRDPTRIRDILPGSDAERQKLKAGDRVLSINGRDTADMTYAELSGQLVGPAGSIIRLAVLDADERKRKVSVKRSLLPEPRVNAERLPGDMLYIRVAKFHRGAANEVLEEIWDHQARGIVLDMRHNDGGLIQEGVSLLDAFFSNGSLGGVRPRPGRPATDFPARTSHTDVTLPLVVLIDGGSASATELVSMVLKERGRATILGAQSMGKGSVQKRISTPDGGLLKVTSAVYVGSKGKPLPADGLMPDRFLPPPRGRTVLEGGPAARDPWVLAAVDVLKGQTRYGGPAKFGPKP